MASSKLMKTYHSIQRKRSWRVLSPKFSFKLLTVVVVLAYFLILKPASALLLPQHPSEQTAADQNNFLHLLVKQRSGGGGGGAGAGRRVLLQADGRLGRPSPVGYPPPGENQHLVPHAPAFPRDGPAAP